MRGGEGLGETAGEADSDRDPASGQRPRTPPGGSDLLFLRLGEATTNLYLTFLEGQTILGKPQVRGRTQTKQEDNAGFRSKGSSTQHSLKGEQENT